MCRSLRLELAVPRTLSVPCCSDDIVPWIDVRARLVKATSNSQVETGGYWAAWQGPQAAKNELCIVIIEGAYLACVLWAAGLNFCRHDELGLWTGQRKPLLLALPKFPMGGMRPWLAWGQV